MCKRSNFPRRGFLLKIIALVINVMINCVKTKFFFFSPTKIMQEMLGVPVKVKCFVSTALITRSILVCPFLSHRIIKKDGASALF